MPFLFTFDPLGLNPLTILTASLLESRYVIIDASLYLLDALQQLVY